MEFLDLKLQTPKIRVLASRTTWTFGVFSLSNKSNLGVQITRQCSSFAYPMQPAATEDSYAARYEAETLGVSYDR